MTNAERQRRFRERRDAGVPVHERRPARTKPRPARWAELRQLQAEYEAWRDGLPESLADSRTAELIKGVCDVDLDALDEPPRGFRPRLNATGARRPTPGHGESDLMLDTHAVAPGR